jgi:hypothetical protein
VFFATEGRLNGFDGPGVLSELELSAGAPNTDVDEAGDPNRLVAGAPNGFEAVIDEELSGNGNFVEEPNRLGVSVEVDDLSALGGFGIPKPVSENVENVVVVAEGPGVEKFPNEEPNEGAPNIFVVLEDSDADAGFRELKELLERLEPAPKMELEAAFISGAEDVLDVAFEPKPSKSDGLGGAGADVVAFSFSGASSYSFCIRDR